MKLKSLKLDWIVYLTGVFLIAGTAHELYHWLNCGGEFVAGVAYLKNSWIFEGTWCQFSTPGGELIPTLIEIYVWITLIIIRNPWGVLSSSKKIHIKNFIPSINLNRFLIDIKTIFLAALRINLIVHA